LFAGEQNETGYAIASSFELIRKAKDLFAGEQNETGYAIASSF
jgi:hypothetical protein